MYNNKNQQRFPCTGTGQIWDKPLKGNFTTALNTWLKHGHIGSQQWSRWCHLGSRQGSITRQVKWMWSEVLCHSCWTPSRTKKRSSSAGVHPSDTETRSKSSATPDERIHGFFFFFNYNSWKVDFLKTLPQLLSNEFVCDLEVTEL